MKEKQNPGSETWKKEIPNDEGWFFMLLHYRIIYDNILKRNSDKINEKKLYQCLCKCMHSLIRTVQ